MTEPPPFEPTHFDIFSILQNAIPWLKFDIYTCMAGVVGCLIIMIAVDYLKDVLYAAEEEAGYRADAKKKARKAAIASEYATQNAAEEKEQELHDSQTSVRNELLIRGNLSMEESEERTQNDDFSDWEEEHDTIGPLEMDRR